MSSKLDQLTIGEARELASLFGKSVPQAQTHPFEIGANYFVRTVTHHLAGKLTEVHPTELVLEKAAWIANDGRLTAALATSTFDEVEMFPKKSRVIVGRGTIIDAVIIETLPVSQK